jgi:hypothetical protein
VHGHSNARKMIMLSTFWRNACETTFLCSLSRKKGAFVRQAWRTLMQACSGASSVDEVPKPYPGAQVALMSTEEQHMCIFEWSAYSLSKCGRGRTDCSGTRPTASAQVSDHGPQMSLHIGCHRWTGRCLYRNLCCVSSKQHVWKLCCALQ